MDRTTERKQWGARSIAALSLSAIPGAGHMFMGRIGKGFALMSLLVFSVFFIILYADALEAYWVIAYLVPTVSLIFLCYSVFDVKALLKAEREGGNAADDELMAAIEKRVLFNPKAIGVTLLAIGVLGVVDWFSVPLNRFLSEKLGTDLPLGALILPLLLFATGIFLVAKKPPRE